MDWRQMSVKSQTLRDKLSSRNKRWWWKERSKKRKCRRRDFDDQSTNLRLSVQECMMGRRVSFEEEQGVQETNERKRKWKGSLTVSLKRWWCIWLYHQRPFMRLSGETERNYESYVRIKRGVNRGEGRWLTDFLVCVHDWIIKHESEISA